MGYTSQSGVYLHLACSEQEVDGCVYEDWDIWVLCGELETLLDVMNSKDVTVREAEEAKELYGILVQSMLAGASTKKRVGNEIKPGSADKVVRELLPSIVQCCGSEPAREFAYNVQLYNVLVPTAYRAKRPELLKVQRVEWSD